MSRPGSPSGKIYFRRANYEDARLTFERVLEDDEASEDAHFYLGEIARASQRFEEAVLHYRKASSAAAGKGLGVALLKLGRYDEAERALEQALSEESEPSERAETLYLLGSVRNERGDEEGAVAALTEASKTDPNHPETRYLLGTTLARLGRGDEARTELEAFRNLKAFEERKEKLAARDCRAPGGGRFLPASHRALSRARPRSGSSTLSRESARSRPRRSGSPRDLGPHPRGGAPPLSMLSALAVASIVLVDRSEAAGIRFKNLFGGADKRFIYETLGSGAAFVDYDEDGLLDVYLVNGAPDLESPGPGSRLYRNRGGSFEDVTEKSGAGDDGFGVAIAVADIEADGDSDLFLATNGSDWLLVNQGDGTFRKLGMNDERMAGGAAFGDYDADGLPDLYVSSYVDRSAFEPGGKGFELCNWKSLRVGCGPAGLPASPDRLYHNEQGRLRDASEETGIASVEPSFGLGVLFADLDLDGRSDIFVANDGRPNFLFRNRGDGTFSEEGLIRGAAYSGDGREQAGMGVDAADIDFDSDPDLVVTNFSHDYTTLYENLGAGFFVDASYKRGIGKDTYFPLSWGVRFVDLDADSDLDLYIANGHIYPEVDRVAPETSYAEPDQVFRERWVRALRARPLGVGAEVEPGARRRRLRQRRQDRSPRHHHRRPRGAPPQRDRTFGSRNPGETRRLAIGARWPRSGGDPRDFVRETADGKRGLRGATRAPATRGSISGWETKTPERSRSSGRREPANGWRSPERLFCWSSRRVSGWSLTAPAPGRSPVPRRGSAAPSPRPPGPVPPRRGSDRGPRRPPPFPPRESRYDPRASRRKRRSG